MEETCLLVHVHVIVKSQVDSLRGDRFGYLGPYIDIILPRTSAALDRMSNASGFGVDEEGGCGPSGTVSMTDSSGAKNW